MTTPDNDEAQVKELIDVGRALVGQIDAFAKSSGVQFVSLAERARANRRAIWGLGVSLLLDFVLTGFMVTSQVQISSTEHRISVLTDRINYSQTVQRQKALCPLYQLLKDSKSTAGRSAAPDPKAYDHAFDVIDRGYTVLDCQEFITKS